MTPAQLKANVDRFNEASEAAATALEGLKAYLEANEIDHDLEALLEAFIGSTAIMVETSSELMGLTGPAAEARAV